ncbi:N-acetylglucosamine-6-phosphate deacetylase [Staphylococcus lugdunensis]|uniref:N-acetylglucosamine-6-phosphate deacetylase n=1 Tax=Staphylococcus lugdunensis TaxID=28035 RepID=A0A4Q9WEA2_STALU|nr:MULTISPECIES: N-acetylglucosamine-6-phosphate deacetylase [Staphylococcus]AMG61880.1 N-acetylglucosamine-6-phosphate deacetylase [Staphylococcus lugdunensis]ARJ10394.1 N-acetylglucosamine-6-phosphate deacetylase [Staphylococcus lugdunensis]AST61137.1 N-acetylglucosamine-6-phosphate deacetylase [Staphylococcus lugdunensis]ATG70129.1 N-acetylglucosamine-6-phosphate deacetylase [Staphylococcus lugdunensis]ATN15376.1 N-acetylglucosamine-6-phosphate deacetylase [Staphylococcus lugdunensis]
MSKYALINGKIYTEQQVIEHGYVVINDGRIEQIASGEYDGMLETVDAQGQHVLPGFIDIHIHGGYGADAMDASYEGLKHLAENLLSEGTTSFLATTMTQSDENIIKALANIAKYHQEQQQGTAAEIVGIHLEGPFISEHKVGAQNPQYVQRPSVDKIQQFQQSAQGLIKVITFAPEVEGAQETLAALHHDIIFSIGHTVADFDQTNEAVTCGAKHITHLYNAATGFEHRKPGVFGAAWTNSGLNTEVIVDGIHSHPTAVKLAYQLKGHEHFYLITDAMRAKGMSDGEYDLGGQNVIVKGSEARLASGSLAGSILKMNDGLKNVMTFTGQGLDQVWRVASLNQAIALKIDDQKGSIAVGKDADLVIVDDDIQVLTTIKAGCMHRYRSLGE